MKKFAAVIAVMALCSAPVMAAEQGGFSGPSATQSQAGGFQGPNGSVTTVESAKSLRDDTWVTLRGNIVERISDDLYVFKDASGTINVDISGDDEYGPSVNFSLGCGDFQGRYIEDYDEKTQRTILDNMETSIARDIAKFCEQGYTFVGIDKASGECMFECFYLEDHKVQWQQDYICNLQIFQQEAANQTHNRQ